MPSRQELLRAVAGRARIRFGAVAATIALHDRATGDLLVVAAVGAGALEGIRFPAGSWLTQAAMRLTRPLVLDDAEADRRLVDDLLAGVGQVPERLALAPLRRDERALGVLCVVDPAPAADREQRVHVALEALAVQAAVVVDVTGVRRDGQRSPEDRLVSLAARFPEYPAERRPAALELISRLEALRGSPADRR